MSAGDRLAAIALVVLWMLACWAITEVCQRRSERRRRAQRRILRQCDRLARSDD